MVRGEQSLLQRLPDAFTRALGLLAATAAIAGYAPSIASAQGHLGATTATTSHNHIDYHSDYEPDLGQTAELGIGAVLVLGLGSCIVGMARRTRRHKDYED